MQYDFDTILDRRGRDALALDMIPYDGVEPKEGFSRIPMWVADMSFPTAPPVLEAIRARLDHPLAAGAPRRHRPGAAAHRL